MTFYAPLPTRESSYQRCQPCCSFDGLEALVPNRTIIYALADPDNPTRVRYVGKAQGELRSRWKAHMSSRNRWKTPKNDWIKSLLKRGRKPIAWTIELCPKEEWEERERFWIAFYRRFGGLLNVTDGGDCGPVRSGWKHTPEALKKISDASKRNPNRNPLLGGWNRGIPMTPEHKAKLQAARLAYKPTSEHIAAHQAAIAKRRGVKRPQWIGDKLKKLWEHRPRRMIECKELGIIGDRHFIAQRLEVLHGSVYTAIRRGTKLKGYTLAYVPNVDVEH